MAALLNCSSRLRGRKLKRVYLEDLNLNINPISCLGISFKESYLFNWNSIWFLFVSMSRLDNNLCLFLFLRKIARPCDKYNWFSVYNCFIMFTSKWVREIHSKFLAHLQAGNSNLGLHVSLKIKEGDFDAWPLHPCLPAPQPTP